VRTVPEWIATHDDQDIPKAVRLRIWEREGGRCYLSGRKITPADTWQFEHVIALECGGQHRESNLRLALTEPHKAKTAADHKLGSKIDRIRLKHIGAWPASKQRIRSAGFQSTRKDIRRPAMGGE
jgi:5-methylcytosine-specific restriction enzyme A